MIDVTFTARFAAVQNRTWTARKFNEEPIANYKKKLEEHYSKI